MKTITTFLLSVSLGALQAQQAVLTSGGDATGSGGSAGYSIGQTVYSTTSGANGSVAQGVQQAFEISTLGIGDNSVALSSVAYPNPTANLLTLNVNDFNEGNMEYVLFDLQGRELLRQKIKQATTQIQMQHLSASIYLLEIINENKLVKTFKIIKN